MNDDKTKFNIDVGPKPEKGNENVGRPTKMTPEVCLKIEQAAALDAGIGEICFYAGISRQTYYNWVKEYPEFFDKVEALRNKPILKARQAIITSLDSPEYAFRYMEKKLPREFGNKTMIEHSGSVASIGTSDPAKQKQAKDVIERFEAELRTVLIRPSEIDKNSTAGPAVSKEPSTTGQPPTTIVPPSTGGPTLPAPSTTMPLELKKP